MEKLVLALGEDRELRLEVEIDDLDSASWTGRPVSAEPGRGYEPGFLPVEIATDGHPRRGEIASAETDEQGILHGMTAFGVGDLAPPAT